MTPLPEGRVGTSTLHHRIMRSFLDRGHAPSLRELAEALDAPAQSVAEGLKALEGDHGVVLHPGTSEIWVAHPFSAAPTAFWVQGRHRGWWGNCAWCSLGIAALAGQEVTIHGHIGGEAEPARVRIEGGTVTEGGQLYVHFPVPMQRAWENVIYTCSTMLLFRAEAEVDDWCTRHRIPRGDVQPVGTIAAFAEAWYGRHLDEDWRKWSTSEARALFDRFGLIHRTWHIEDSTARF